MATSSSYRGGSIWSMVPGSGETLGTGGQLLNNNFTELYDMVRPPYSTEKPIVYVPTTSEESSEYRYARTINVPDPSNASLNASSDYVPVLTYYGSGYANLGWKPYVSGAGGGNAGSQTDNSSDVSELYAPASSLPYYYIGSDSNGNSAWTSYESYAGSYRKTYKSVIFGKTLQISLPAFGAWLATGTVLAYRSDTYLSGNTSGRLMRVYVAGFDSTIKLSHVDVYDQSNNKWASAMNGYPNITVVSNQMKLKLDEHWDVGCMLHDITIVGGGQPKVNASGSLYFNDFS